MNTGSHPRRSASKELSLSFCTGSHLAISSCTESVACSSLDLVFRVKTVRDHSATARAERRTDGRRGTRNDTAGYQPENDGVQAALSAAKHRSQLPLQRNCHSERPLLLCIFGADHSLSWLKFGELQSCQRSGAQFVDLGCHHARINDCLCFRSEDYVLGDRIAA